MKYLVVRKAWNNFKDLKARCSFQLNHNIWEEILVGKMEPLRQDLIKEGILWEVGKPCIITMQTSWDALISTFLWNIWCRNVTLILDKTIFTWELFIICIADDNASRNGSLEGVALAQLFSKKKAKLDTNSIKVFHKVNYFVYYREY